MLSNNELHLVEQLLQHNIRLDGRKQPFQSRTFKAQFLDEPGHLLFSQGNTLIFIKIKADITAPKPQRPSEGFILFRVDCTACNNVPDHNKKLAVEISKLLETIILGSNALDAESLCIVTGKYVWKLIVDCIVVNDDGNTIQTTLNAAVVALMDMRKPYIQVGKQQIQVDSNKLQVLSLAHIPISISFALVPNSIFADPTFIEEKISPSKITITMNVYKEICSIHKSGGLGISSTIIAGVIKIIEEKVKALTESFREMVKKRPLAKDHF